MGNYILISFMKIHTYSNALLANQMSNILNDNTSQPCEVYCRDARMLQHLKSINVITKLKS